MMVVMPRVAKSLVIDCVSRWWCMGGVGLDLHHVAEDDLVLCVGEMVLECWDFARLTNILC